MGGTFIEGDIMSIKLLILSFFASLSVLCTYSMEKSVELTPKSKQILDDPTSTPSKKAVALSNRVQLANRKTRKTARSILEQIENLQEKTPEGYPAEKAQLIQENVEKIRLGLEDPLLLTTDRGSFSFHELFSKFSPKRVDDLVRVGIADLASPKRAPYTRFLDDFSTQYAIDHIVQGSKKGGSHFCPIEGVSARESIVPTENLDNGVLYAWPSSTDEAKSMYPSSLDKTHWFEALKHIVADPIAMKNLKKGKGSYMIGQDHRLPFHIEVIRNIRNVDGVDISKVASAYPIFSYTKWQPEGIQHIATVKNLETGEEKTLDFTADELKNLTFRALDEYESHYSHDHPLRYSYINSDGIAMHIIDIGLKLTPFGFPLRGVYIEIPASEISSS